MKIQIWSDVYCPFCYIGEKTLKEALQNYPDAKEVEIEYKSFELDPASDFSDKLSMYEYVAKKYGMSMEKVLENYRDITKRGEEVGIDFHFDKLILVNTFNAHRLIQYAKTHQKDAEMTERLFKALFTEGKDLADFNTLVQLAKEVGLDGTEVYNMLVSNAFKEAVRKDEREGSVIGVRSVPFFLFDNKIALNGAHHISAFEEVIEKAFGFKKNKIEIITDDSACGPDGCKIN